MSSIIKKKFNNFKMAHELNLAALNYREYVQRIKGKYYLNKSR